MVQKMLSACAMWALCLIVFLPASANASLQVDLRFPDGSHSKFLSATGTYTVQVWAQVRGTNTTGTDDGLEDLFGSIQSQQVGLGALQTGGVTGNSGLGPIFTTGGIMGSPGTPQNITPDGIQDWGTTSTLNLNTIKYNTTLNAGLDPAYSSTPGVTANLLGEASANAGVEFEVGQFTVSANSILGLGDGQTIFNWIKSPGPTAAHIHFVDGGDAETGSAKYLASISPTNSVTFFVPEPGCAALLGTTLLAIAVRRRRK